MLPWYSSYSNMHALAITCGPKWTEFVQQWKWFVLVKIFVWKWNHLDSASINQSKLMTFVNISQHEHFKCNPKNSPLWSIQWKRKFLKANQSNSAYTSSRNQNYHLETVIAKSIRLRMLSILTKLFWWYSLEMNIFCKCPGNSYH